MAMSTEDRAAALAAKTAPQASTVPANVTNPDLLKLIQMASMPTTIAMGGNEVGASRSQEQQAARTLKQFNALGGQAEFDRVKSTVMTDPALKAQFDAIVAEGNKGDALSKIGDFVVSKVPIALQIAAIAAGVDLAMGGTLIASGAGGTGAGAGGLETGVTSAMEAAGQTSAAASPGVATSTAAGNVATGLGYAPSGAVATEGVGNTAFNTMLNQALPSPTQVIPQGSSTVPTTTVPNLKVPTATPDWVTAGGMVLPALMNALNPTPTPGPNTSTSQNVYSPAEQTQRDYMLAEARRVYDAAVAAEIAGGNPNAAVAPQSPDTIAAQNALRQYATGAASAMTKEQQAAQTYGLTTAMDVNNNPYLQNAIQAALRPVTQSYTDPSGVLSKIRGDALQSGQYGGTRQGLGEGVAAGRYLQVVGDTAGKMASDAYNKGQDTFSRTLALSPSLIQSGQQPASMLSAIGTQNEAFAQEQEQAKATGRQWDLAKGFQPLQSFTNLVNASTNPVATSTAPPTPAPRKNLVGDAVSGAILANQLWGAFNK